MQIEADIFNERSRPYVKSFFVIMYFLVFLFLIDLVFRSTATVTANLLAVACWVIAFIASVGLADLTAKKIRKI